MTTISYKKPSKILDTTMDAKQMLNNTQQINNFKNLTSQLDESKQIYTIKNTTSRNSNSQDSNHIFNSIQKVPKIPKAVVNRSNSKSK